MRNRHRGYNDLVTRGCKAGVGMRRCNSAEQTGQVKGMSCNQELGGNQEEATPTLHTHRREKQGTQGKRETQEAPVVLVWLI